MIRFHFPCVALCEIDVWTGDHDEPVPEMSSAEVRGIFADRHDMAVWLRAAAIRDQQRAREEWQKYGPFAYKLPRRVWVAVSLDHIEGDSLDEIEENIKAAALLQWQGFGKPVAA